MIKKETFRSSRLPSTYGLVLVALVVLLLLIAACGGGEAVPGEGENAVATNQGQLACSQECRDRGQCGDSPDRGTVILLNREQPAVDRNEHDLAIAQATTVDILERQTRTVVEEATGNAFPVEFFRVNVPERGEVAWVASWCFVSAAQ